MTTQISKLANSTQKIQRQPLSLSQLRIALHLRADGVVIPETAVLSRQKFSTFMQFVEEELLKSRKAKVKKTL